MSSTNLCSALLLVAVAALSTNGHATQSVQERTGVCFGKVVDFETGKPVAGANIVVRPVKGNAIAVITSNAGDFVARGLAGGLHTIQTSDPALTRSYFGDRFPGDRAIRSIEIPPGGTLGPLTMRVWQMATAAGRVVDGDEAVVNVQVVAYREIYDGGHRRFDRVATGTTNDQGEYRIANLPPGSYVLGVPRTSPNSLASRALVYSSTYFPALLKPEDAVSLTFKSGEEKPGLVFNLERSASVSITGNLVGLPTETSRVQVDLLLADSRIDVPVSSYVAQSPEMKFAFEKIPIGLYRIRFVSFPAIPPPDGGPRWPVQNSAGTSAGPVLAPGGGYAPYPALPKGETFWADQLVVAGAGSSPVSVAAKKGFRLSGEVRFRGDLPQLSAADLNRTAVLVLTADGRDFGVSFPMTRVESDGSFRTVGLPPGRYVLLPFMGTPGLLWAFHSVAVNGNAVFNGTVDLNSDVSDVVIGFSDKLSSITGTVSGAPQMDVQDSSVLLFPADRRAWIDFSHIPFLFREVRPKATGQFDVGIIPPGDYYLIAAVPGRASWKEADWLARLAASAELVRVREGEKLDRAIRVREIGK